MSNDRKTENCSFPAITHISDITCTCCKQLTKTKAKYLRHWILIALSNTLKLSSKSPLFKFELKLSRALEEFSVTSQFWAQKSKNQIFEESVHFFHTEVQVISNPSRRLEKTHTKPLRSCL